MRQMWRKGCSKAYVAAARVLGMMGAKAACGPGHFTTGYVSRCRQGLSSNAAVRAFNLLMEQLAVEAH